MSLVPFVRIWIVIGALAGVAGCILSALGELNLAGYSIFGVLCLGGRLLTRGKTSFSWKNIPLRRLRTRFSQPLPVAFAGLAALVFLGGALYEPSNYDGLTYRLPRVLHWLARQQWHWIHTNNYRMNDRSCGFEWLMAPVILATRSDRALFLINFLPFLLLPGLVFSVFTRLGVAPRVAWQWMWLLPTGYNFLLQAGSLGNDTFAAVYVLAAIDFALRARASRDIMDVWFSLLAAALMTGAKSGNLPLLLPWSIAFFPVARTLFSRPVSSLFITLTALSVSFLPNAIINSRFCGDWTGLSLETSFIAMRHPLLGIAGNSVMLLIGNFVPTFFPLAGWWNYSALSMLPHEMSSLLLANFESNFYNLGEMPIEEQTGLGFGLSCLLAIHLLTMLYRRRAGFWSCIRRPPGAVMASAYVSLLFFFAKSGMEAVARLVSAYYPLLLPALVIGPVSSALVRQRWWRSATYIALTLSLAVVVLTPARPLWPAATVLARLPDDMSDHPLIKRLKDVYLGYAKRPDSLAEARTALPDACPIVGSVIDCNDSEISLWRPFGRRRVEDILLDEPAETIHARGIEYAVVSELYLKQHGQNVEDWVQQHHARAIKSFTATLIIRTGPQKWHVIRFDAPVSNQTRGANAPDPRT
jgi:hypothetical protein